MSFRIDDEQLLETYKVIWTKIEDLSKNISWNFLPVYGDRYIKTKIRIPSDQLYNFRGLNMAKDGIERESFIVIFIDSLIACRKKNIICKYI